MIFLQDEERAENAANGVIAVGEANLGMAIVERSERSACFRVKISDAGIYYIYFTEIPA